MVTNTYCSTECLWKSSALEHTVFIQQKLYRSDLNYLRGAAWIATGALQIEGSKRATDLISEVWMAI